jgi:hypothetical protein
VPDDDEKDDSPKESPRPAGDSTKSHLPKPLDVFEREWPALRQFWRSAIVICITCLGLGAESTFGLFKEFILPGKEDTISAMKERIDLLEHDVSSGSKVSVEDYNKLNDAYGKLKEDYAKLKEAKDKMTADDGESSGALPDPMTETQKRELVDLLSKSKTHSLKVITYGDSAVAIGKSIFDAFYQVDPSQPPMDSRMGNYGNLFMLQLDLEDPLEPALVKLIKKYYPKIKVMYSSDKFDASAGSDVEITVSANN